MKVTLKRKVEREEVSLGNKGDFVLIQFRGKNSYRFGKLEDTIKQVGHFKGNSYYLHNEIIFGEEVPNFTKHSHGYGTNSFNRKFIEKIFVGKDEIIKELSKDKRYEQHIKYIQRMK